MTSTRRYDMRTFGNNSGYIGCSESVRSANAKANGKYPKTLFKKTYGLSEKKFNELVSNGTIGVTEWHHTSKFGNKTQFYEPLVEQWRFLYRIGCRSEAYDEYIKEKHNAEWLNAIDLNPKQKGLFGTFNTTALIPITDERMEKILSYGAPVEYTKRKAFAKLPVLGWKHLLKDAFVRKLFTADFSPFQWRSV